MAMAAVSLLWAAYARHSRLFLSAVQFAPRDEVTGVIALSFVVRVVEHGGRRNAPEYTERRRAISRSEICEEAYDPRIGVKSFFFFSFFSRQKRRDPRQPVDYKRMKMTNLPNLREISCSKENEKKMAI